MNTSSSKNGSSFNHITRKLLSILLSIIMLITIAQIGNSDFCILPKGQFANASTVLYSGSCGSNVTWSLDNQGVLTISGSGRMQNYNVAETVPWDVYRDRILHAKISSGITYLSSWTFYKCTNLQTVLLPSTITQSGGGVFYDCSSLKSVDIPNSWTSIEDSTFYGCSSLESITFPEGITRIDSFVFHGCSNLRTVVFPQSLIDIQADELFNGCYNLTSITVADGNPIFHSSGNCLIETASKILIDGCANSVIPDDGSVISIGSNDNSSVTGEIYPYPFYNSGIKNIYIPACITSISYGAFSNCERIDTIEVAPANEEYRSNGNCLIRDNTVLRGCKNSIIPSDGSVLSIYDDAFQNCKGLTHISIPASISNIGYKTFLGCDNLVSLEVEEGNRWYHSESNCIIRTSNKVLLFGCRNSIIPSDGTVTSIAPRAFKNSGKLEKITIPSAIKEIGTGAFEGCSSLKTVTISDGVETLRQGAFSDCVSLKSVSLPSSVKSIEYFTFHQCSSLGSIIIYNSSCSIYNDGYNTIPKQVTIFGYRNSTAQSYANSFSLGFVCIGTSSGNNDNKLEISKSSLSISIGSTAQLSLTAFGSAVGQNIKWTSSNDGVASVSRTGKVTANNSGSAIITAITADGKCSVSCSITVISSSSDSIRLNFSSISISKGTGQTISATVSPSNRTVTWTSSNSSVVSVNKTGYVYGVAPGTAIITATTNGGKTASCSVSVIDQSNNNNFHKSESISFTGGSINAELDSTWFSLNNKTYNHALCKFASLVSVLSYKSLSSIKENLGKLGFETTGNGFDSYWVDAKKSDLHKNGYIITKQTFGNETLVYVICRGTNGNEWYSDFMPGQGDTHYSFQSGATYVISALNTFMTRNNLWSQGNNVNILISGHSRGAAVANLIGAFLDDNYSYPNNVYVYTFATPNVTTKAKTTSPNEKYKNIFNIVNPEDFVTKVLPSKWGYGRYGNTIVLPSKTNDAITYTIAKSTVRSNFKKMTNDAFLPYPDGEKSVYDVINSLTKEFKSISDYYNKKARLGITKVTPYLYFQETLLPFVAPSSAKMISAASMAINSEFACSAYKNMTNFFLSKQVLNPYFEFAHRAETYCAYVYSLGSSDMHYRDGYKQTINCPVDIEVTDNETGEIVAKIVNNVVDDAIAGKDYSLVACVDGDCKTIYIPSTGSYSVTLLGNDNGQMDYSIIHFDADGSEIDRSNYCNIPIVNGIEMKCDVIETDEGDILSALVNEYGVVCGDEEYVSPEDNNSLAVNISVDGIGYTDGSGLYTVGDYVTLSAETDSNNQFLGWYSGSELLSEESNYCFVIKQAVNLTACFTNNYIQISGLITDMESIRIDLSSETPYELIHASLLPENATLQAIEWKSNDDTIVTIDAFGLILAIAIGDTTIQAISEDTLHTKTIPVTVFCSHSNNGWSEWIETTVPTCTEEGVKTRSCSFCNAVETTRVVASGHNYGEVIIPPTCFAEGYTKYTCSRCGDSYTNNPVPPMQHEDLNGDGYCDYGCGTYLGESSTSEGQGDTCKYCGKVHTGSFGGIIKFFHNIAYFFAHLFGRK